MLPDRSYSASATPERPRSAASAYRPRTTPSACDLLKQAEPIEVPLVRGLAREATEQEVRDVVGQGAADQELHREIVDSFGILTLVGFLREHPALGEDVAHRASQSLKPLPRACGRQIHNVIEEEVAFV